MISPCIHCLAAGGIFGKKITIRSGHLQIQRCFAERSGGTHLWVWAGLAKPRASARSRCSPGTAGQEVNRPLRKLNLESPKSKTLEPITMYHSRGSFGRAVLLDLCRDTMMYWRKEWYLCMAPISGMREGAARIGTRNLFPGAMLP